MTKILGVDVRDATEVSSGMCCTLKVVPCRGILCASTIWSSSATANLPLLIFSTKTVILTLPLLTCLLQIPLFILKQISSYLLSFCPWCWWKKLPLNIHFFLLGVLPLSSPLPWLVLDECLWRHLSAGQLWRYRGGPGAETLFVLLNLALCRLSFCDIAWVMVSPALSTLDLGLVCPQWFLPLSLPACCAPSVSGFVPGYQSQNVPQCTGTWWPHVRERMDLSFFLLFYFEENNIQKYPNL